MGMKSSGCDNCCLLPEADNLAERSIIFVLRSSFGESGSARLFDGSGRGGSRRNVHLGSGKVIIKTFGEWSPAEEMDGRRGDGDGDVSRPAGADVYDIPRLPGES